ncbi:protein translocase subunit SecD [Corynebacterium sp. 320]|uniref:Protein translocase subunit SecD n=1 Tax=Corynebacterium zhongnanshanii TaxID=2768834 RepID=A0ABQ6VGX4_9CORY|nr:protein translocase subunit SecD [Corynebacterium sp. 320]KAB1553428.1 protein translocase subunit SecD [Corynebacterium sp. 321]KAB1554463.1 protein translocase subunit SecD [Corynebacterium sp. 319]KAB3523675.1 protein translocase subunit SecD [Corynebacterium zhongnanshanii]KAB3528648.1 protein translocase subunit SecD [Corynebacterium sp. 250]KAB3540916.1 protein translocase subunit SecD [Corynebacterium sp. 366]MCR5913436.1 protein translocase subunit SecD [Corynebacterium sp. zg254]
MFLLIAIVVTALIAFTGNKSFAPKLGIDLQGGTRVTLVPQGDQPTQDQLSQARSILENRVNGMGVSGAEVVTDGNNLVISVPGEDAGEARTLGKTSKLSFRAVSQPTPPSQNFPRVLEDMANRWVENGILTPEEANAKLAQFLPNLGKLGIQNPPKEMKVTEKAPAEPKTDKDKDALREKQVQVSLKDRQSADADVQQAAAVLLPCDGLDPLSGADDLSKPLVACSKLGALILEPAPLLKGETDEEHGRRLDGSMIDTNSQITGGLDTRSQQMAITFRFKTGDATPGGETWYALGREQLQKQVAIVLDSEVISAPRIQSPTPPGETSQITGDFPEQEAVDIANNLKYGALPLSFTGENGEQGGTTQTISPTLGDASLKAGLIAGLIGLVLVSLYALAYYRGLGFVAIVSLVAAFALIYGFIVLLGRWIGYSLDLAGIAGLIIGIGTTADSFVIYFERIKDEIRQGATFRSAVPRAWTRARSTIITGNFVSLIAAVILYFLAIGQVKGFAFTLGLTTFFDVVIAFLVSAPLVILLSKKPFFANPKVNGLGSAFRAAEREAQRAAVAGATDTTAHTERKDSE